MNNRTCIVFKNNIVCCKFFPPYGRLFSYWEAFKKFLLYEWKIFQQMEWEILKHLRSFTPWCYQVRTWNRFKFRDFNLDFLSWAEGGSTHIRSFSIVVEEKWVKWIRSFENGRIILLNWVIGEWKWCISVKTCSVYLPFLEIFGTHFTILFNVPLGLGENVDFICI